MAALVFPPSAVAFAPSAAAVGFAAEQGDPSAGAAAEQAGDEVSAALAEFAGGDGPQPAREGVHEQGVRDERPPSEVHPNEDGSDDERPIDNRFHLQACSYCGSALHQSLPVLLRLIHRLARPSDQPQVFLYV